MSDNMKKVLVGLIFAGSMFLAGYEVGKLVETLKCLSGTL